MTAADKTDASAGFASSILLILRDLPTHIVVVFDPRRNAPEGSPTRREPCDLRGSWTRTRASPPLLCAHRPRAAPHAARRRGEDSPAAGVAVPADPRRPPLHRCPHACAPPGRPRGGRSPDPLLPQKEREYAQGR